MMFGILFVSTMAGWLMFEARPHYIEVKLLHTKRVLTELPDATHKYIFYEPT